MGTLETILREDAESKARLQAAKLATFALTPTERRSFIVEVLAFIEDEETSGIRRVSLAEGSEVDDSFVQKCQALLGEHPEGLSTAEVALAIGQTISGASGTLTWLKKKYPGHLINRGNRWMLLRPIEKKKQLREFIREALIAAGTPLDAKTITVAVNKGRPNTKRATVNCELLRMQAAGCVFPSGKRNARGGQIFSLTPPFEAESSQ